MAMAIGTLALKLFENGSPLPMTPADLAALSPDVDFKTTVPLKEWTNIVVLPFTDSSAARAAKSAHFILDTRNGKPVVRTTDLWRQQFATLAVDGDFASITIGVKGDFSKTPPTPVQMDKLVKLVCMLQQLRNIPRQNVTLHEPGAAFPRETFGAKLLR